jgi:hypothetical protein
MRWGSTGEARGAISRPARVSWPKSHLQSWARERVYKASEARIRPEFILPSTCLLELSDHRMDSGR